MQEFSEKHPFNYINAGMFGFLLSACLVVMAYAMWNSGYQRKSWVSVLTVGLVVGCLSVSQLAWLLTPSQDAYTVPAGGILSGVYEECPCVVFMGSIVLFPVLFDVISVVMQFFINFALTMIKDLLNGSGGVSGGSGRWTKERNFYMGQRSRVGTLPVIDVGADGLDEAVKRLNEQANQPPDGYIVALCQDKTDTGLSPTYAVMLYEEGKKEDAMKASNMTLAFTKYAVGDLVQLTDNKEFLKSSFDTVLVRWGDEMVDMLGLTFKVLETSENSRKWALADGSTVGLRAPNTSVDNPDGSQEGVWYFPVIALTKLKPTVGMKLYFALQAPSSLFVVPSFLVHLYHFAKLVTPALNLGGWSGMILIYMTWCNSGMTSFLVTALYGALLADTVWGSPSLKFWKNPPGFRKAAAVILFVLQFPSLAAFTVPGMARWFWLFLPAEVFCSLLIVAFLPEALKDLRKIFVGLKDQLPRMCAGYHGITEVIWYISLLNLLALAPLALPVARVCKTVGICYERSPLGYASKTFVISVFVFFKVLEWQFFMNYFIMWYFFGTDYAHVVELNMSARHWKCDPCVLRAEGQEERGIVQEIWLQIASLF